MSMLGHKHIFFRSDQLLEIKLMFKLQDLQMFGLKLNKCD